MVLFVSCLSMVSSGQVTETYTIQTSNFDASHTTNTNSDYFAGAYNNNGSEIGTYANGSRSGYTGILEVSIFRSFTDDGTSTSGSSRDLQVGDEFKITAYVGNKRPFLAVQMLVFLSTTALQTVLFLITMPINDSSYKLNKAKTGL